MREIKFRGKRVDNGEWVYGYFYFELEHTDNGAPEHYYREYDIQLPYITDGQHSVLVDPETVGQYTGLKDNNGKDVYEGDIIKLSDYIGLEHIAVVKYEDHLLQYIFKATGGYYSNMDTNEVIGNIYENPELLEERKK